MVRVMLHDLVLVFVFWCLDGTVRLCCEPRMGHGKASICEKRCSFSLLFSIRLVRTGFLLCSYGLVFFFNPSRLQFGRHHWFQAELDSLGVSYTVVCLIWMCLSYFHNSTNQVQRGVNDFLYPDIQTDHAL